MVAIALKMLTGDRAKYFGVLLGLTFTSFFMTQQPAMFFGILSREFGFLSDAGLANVWVMDPTVQYVDDVKPLSDNMLGRVRGVAGVAWAVPIYKGNGHVRQPDGKYQSSVLVGLDDATLMGGPATMISGSLADLRRTDGIIVNQDGADRQLATPNVIAGQPPIPLKIGDVITMNDRRAVVVGISAGGLNTSGSPTIYTTYSRAKTYAPKERNMLSFILVKVKSGFDAATVIRNIRRWTGLAAYTGVGFERKTALYMITSSPAFTVFGLSAIIGFLIGGLIAGQIFYNFTLENLRYFGVMKAMGATNGVLRSMIMAQALVAGAIGYGLGIGAVGLLGLAIGNGGRFPLQINWTLLLASAFSVVAVCVAASAISLRRVIRLEPASVFKS
jgi:putative ABC transport system permease protein